MGEVDRVVGREPPVHGTQVVVEGLRRVGRAFHRRRAGMVRRTVHGASQDQLLKVLGVDLGRLHLGTQRVAQLWPARRQNRP